MGCVLFKVPWLEQWLEQGHIAAVALHLVLPGQVVRGRGLIRVERVVKEAGSEALGVGAIDRGC